MSHLLLRQQLDEVETQQIIIQKLLTIIEGSVEKEFTDVRQQLIKIEEESSLQLKNEATNLGELKNIVQEISRVQKHLDRIEESIQTHKVQLVQLEQMQQKGQMTLETHFNAIIQEQHVLQDEVKNSMTKILDSSLQNMNEVKNEIQQKMTQRIYEAEQSQLEQIKELSLQLKKMRKATWIRWAVCIVLFILLMI